VNGVQPNANTTRVDGAVSVNVWLPHHAMYIQSAESIDSVNVATNNFDADTGMAAGAAQTVITSRAPTRSAVGVLFPQQRRPEHHLVFQRLLRPPREQDHTADLRRHHRRADREEQAVLLLLVRGLLQHPPTQVTYSVPTAKMRAGDFSEVVGAYPTFKLYNPFSDRTGAAREQWTNNIIPSQYISPIAMNVLKYFPAVNSTKDLNGNLLFDDYVQQRDYKQERNNIDLKVNWQLKPTAMVWGKFGMMKNWGTGDNFILGFDNPSDGDTRVILTTFGTTWTLGPSTVFDANFGMSRQDQTVLPPDYGTNYGLQLGIKGVNNRTTFERAGCRPSAPPTPSARLPAGCRCGARRSATRARRR